MVWSELHAVLNRYVTAYEKYVDLDHVKQLGYSAEEKPECKN